MEYKPIFQRHTGPPPSSAHLLVPLTVEKIKSAASSYVPVNRSEALPKNAVLPTLNVTDLRIGPKVVIKDYVDPRNDRSLKKRKPPGEDIDFTKAVIHHDPNELWVKKPPPLAAQSSDLVGSKLYNTPQPKNAMQRYL